MEEQQKANEEQQRATALDRPMVEVEPRFDAGQLNLTPRAAIVLSPSDIKDALHWHVRGDWGLLSNNEQQAETACLELGLPVQSIWVSESGFEFCVRTEADRSMTTICLEVDDC